MLFLQIFSGLLLLFLGGESLVRGAIEIAKKFNLSKALIAVTIVAYGTSSPELLITLKANLTDHTEIALGNVLGSNITNIFLVLGLAALLSPIHVHKDLVKFDMKYVIISSIALLFFMMSGFIGRIEALIFIVILLIYSVSTLKRHTKGKDESRIEQTEEFEEHLKFKFNIYSAVIAFIAGIFMLAAGSHILVEGASELARFFNMSEAVIAVTVVSIGGSAPEIATSVIAAYRKHADIAIGNVIGSNIFNILGVLGISSLVKPIPTRGYDVVSDAYSTSSTLAIFDIWVMVFASLLLYYVVKKNLLITRSKGIAFLFCYGLYILWQLKVSF